jgi:hypothetical protein
MIRGVIRRKWPFMYYATIYKNSEAIVHRKPFNDFSDAIDFTSSFYRLRLGGTLSFTTEVINGKLARSYAELVRLADVEAPKPFDQWRYQQAAKQSSSFDFNGTYLFMIETDFGIFETERYNADEEEN